MNLTRIWVSIKSITTIQAKILKELLADGRKTDSEIAENIESTKEAVKKNYDKLEQIGIITGATIHINYKIFGYKAVAHILITVDSRQADQLFEYLQKRWNMKMIIGSDDFVEAANKIDFVNKTLFIK